MMIMMMMMMMMIIILIIIITIIMTIAWGYSTPVPILKENGFVLTLVHSTLNFTS